MQISANALRRIRSKGSSLLEFALVIIVLVPLFFGTFSIGMSLTRTVQASVISRDAGAMFMRYVDFTQDSNKDLLLRLSNGFNITRTGGNGLIIMTQITFIGAIQCAQGGLSTGACPNFNHPVVVKRVTVGNASVYTTRFGNPTPAIIQGDGSITLANYLSNTTARATNLSPILSLNPGEYAYVAEAYFRTPELDLPGYRSDTYVYQRNIF